MEDNVKTDLNFKDIRSLMEEYQLEFGNVRLDEECRIYARWHLLLMC